MSVFSQIQASDVKPNQPRLWITAPMNESRLLSFKTSELHLRANIYGAAFALVATAREKVCDNSYDVVNSRNLGASANRRYFKSTKEANEWLTLNMGKIVPSDFHKHPLNHDFYPIAVVWSSKPVVPPEPLPVCANPRWKIVKVGDVKPFESRIYFHTAKQYAEWFVGRNTHTDFRGHCTEMISGYIDNELLPFKFALVVTPCYLLPVAVVRGEPGYVNLNNLNQDEVDWICDLIRDGSSTAASVRLKKLFATSGRYAENVKTLL